MKKFFLSAVTILASHYLFSQNVGIGTSAPAYKLDVAGAVRSTGDIYTGGYIGIGTTSPAYKLTVQDGSVAIFNSADTKTWFFNYNSSGNYFQLSEGGINRLTVANGGNVGIGTTTPSSPLDVVGNAEITGNLTVNNGKGILRSWNGSQIKYYTQESSVHAILPAFGTSIEGAIAWTSGIFTTAPQVLVGDITSTSATTGQLYRVQIVCYDATTNSCHFRLINTSNVAVDNYITWNIVLLGQ